MKEYYGCNWIEKAHLNFNGQITDEWLVALCCENINDADGKRIIPSIPLHSGDGGGIIKCFMEMRKSVIENGHHGCKDCVQYQKKQWRENEQIHYVNLSMYPSPCQAKCVYCSLYGDDRLRFNDEIVKQGYENIFDAVAYGLDSGTIHPNAFFQVSCGEIAIHPYKDRIFDLVKGRACAFFTNAFIYDEKIAHNLSSNPNSSINLSIDAGTPQTWLDVKGVDNFQQVVDNLIRYSNASHRPGQITLKYIIMPNVNTFAEDFIGVINIIKALKIRGITLSRDVRIKYNHSSQEQDELIVSAGYFAAMLQKSGVKWGMTQYSGKEQKDIVAFAKDALKTGQI